MRHTGWIRNVDISKLHTELIIKELWALKTYAIPATLITVRRLVPDSHFTNAAQMSV